MKVDTVTDCIVAMIQDSFFGIADALADVYKRLFSAKATPSLLAYNVHWFTNCSWIEQLWAFQQIDMYLDQGKCHNEKL